MLLETQTTQRSFQRCLEIRRSLSLCISLSELLDYQENSIKKQKHPHGFLCYFYKQDKKISVTPAFRRAFGTLSRNQKMQYYCNCVQYLDMREDGDPTRLQHSRQIILKQQDQPPKQFSVYLKGHGLNHARWREYPIQISFEDCHLRIPIAGRLDQPTDFDLKQYLIRTSKNRKKHAFALEAKEPQLKGKTLKVGFDQQQKYRLCRKCIDTVMLKALRENLEIELRNHEDYRLRNSDRLRIQALLSSQDRERLTPGYRYNLKSKQTPYNQLIANVPTAKYQTNNDGLIDADSQISEILGPLQSEKSLVELLLVSGSQMGCDKIARQAERQNQILEYAKQDRFKKGSAVGISSQEYQHVFQKTKLDIFHILIPGFQAESIFSQTNFTHVKEQNSSSLRVLKILQSKEQAKVFKLVLRNIKTSALNLVGLLADPALHRRFNLEVEFGNLKFAIKSENSCLAYEKHICFSKEYYPRDFLFIRHLFKKKDTYYIVDRSVQHSTSPSFNSVIRGNIKYRIWGVSPDKMGTVKLTVQMQIDYLGSLDLKKQTQLAVRYLEGTSNVFQYITSPRLSTVKTAECVLNPGWHASDHKEQDDGMVFEEFQEGHDLHLFDHDLCEQINTEDERLEEEQCFYSIAEQDWLDYASKRKSSQPNNPEERQRKYSTDSEANLFNKLIDTMSGPKNSAQRLPPAVIKQQQEQSDFKSFPSKPTPKINQAREVPALPTRNSSIAIMNFPCMNFDEEGHVVLPNMYLRKHHLTQPYKSSIVKMRGKNWEHFLWRDLWARTEEGELKCINEAKVKEQSKAIGHILKSMARNIVSGKGILNVSLPVEVFSELSVLQLLARSCCLCPFFLEQAAEVESPLERMKLVMCFGLSFSLLYLEMEKPFNPILGQTFQGWIKGCPIYCQQTNHHPPRSSFLLIGKAYRIYGSIEYKFNISANSGVGSNEGEIIVEFDNFPHAPIHYQGPSGQMTGLVYGDRKFHFNCNSLFYDTWNNMFGYIEFNSAKHHAFGWLHRKQASDNPHLITTVDQIQGKICSVDPGFIGKFRQVPLDKRQVPKPQETTNVLCEVTGRWTDSLLFNDTTYFRVQDAKPFALEMQKYPLASNSGYREDIVYRRKEDFARAQVEKQRLEGIQRSDQKLRRHRKI